MPAAGPASRSRRAAFNRALLAWAAASGRQVEIRDAATPWEILVGEVMSQQTQIARIGPAWRRFIGRWPTPESLAAADTRSLLLAWAGLGYNRRALALREAARVIVRDHGGAVPRRLADLEALPGLGPYTARAVAAAAFGTPVAPLDVNVRRVTRRVLGLDGRTSARDVQVRADALVARRAARRWVDAVMDLAAIVCTRRDPDCATCPVRRWCAAPGEDARGRDESGPAGVVARSSPQPFPSTRRWLRGRLLQLARAAEGGSWTRVPQELGVHDRSAIEDAVAALDRDGLVERHRRDPSLIRVPE